MQEAVHLYTCLNIDELFPETKAMHEYIRSAPDSYSFPAWRPQISYTVQASNKRDFMQVSECAVLLRSMCSIDLTHFLPTSIDDVPPPARQNLVKGGDPKYETIMSTKTKRQTSPSASIPVRRRILWNRSIDILRCTTEVTK